VGGGGRGLGSCGRLALATISRMHVKCCTLGPLGLETAIFRDGRADARIAGGCGRSTLGDGSGSFEGTPCSLCPQSAIVSAMQRSGSFGSHVQPWPVDVDVLHGN